MNTDTKGTTMNTMRNAMRALDTDTSTTAMHARMADMQVRAAYIGVCRSLERGDAGQ